MRKDKVRIKALEKELGEVLLKLQSVQRKHEEAQAKIGAIKRILTPPVVGGSGGSGLGGFSSGTGSVTWNA